MILTALPSPTPSLVHAAKRRRPATVALDLRLAGRVAAVAAGRRGEIAAWAVLAGGDPPALARRALRELGVRPREVRVLLGASEAQVAFLELTGRQADAPDAAAIAAALFAEGYERLREPAVASLVVSSQAWLVAACGGGTVEPLAAALLEESGTEPLFVVDQLLVAADLEAGSARVEAGETGLLIVAAPSGSPPVVRCLPALSGVEEAAREIESLEAAGVGAIQVLGPHRIPLSRLLAARGLAARAEELPASGGETLPAACELAWRLALHSTPPRLASPRGERRRAGLLWARRTIRFAMVTAALGALLMMASLRMTWLNRARSQALAARTAADARLVPELRKIGALADEVDHLRAGLAGQTAPWPRLAEPVAALARQPLPPGVGWERLQVKDGALELEAAAVGEAPFGRLEILRHALERSPSLVNLSWATPAADPHGHRLRQVFRATVQGAPAAAPEGTP